MSFLPLLMAPPPPLPQPNYHIGDPILHIELRRWADVVLIAPCSANTLAKIANGMCDNLVVSVRLCLSARPALSVFLPLPLPFAIFRLSTPLFHTNTPQLLLLSSCSFFFFSDFERKNP
jgi:Flavoprotein